MELRRKMPLCVLYINQILFNMKVTNFFDSPFHDLLSDEGKRDVDKAHTEWLKDMIVPFLFGLFLGAASVYLLSI